MILKLINPLTNTEDVLELERPLIDYGKWVRDGDKDTIKSLNEILVNLDCTREYSCGRPMSISNLRYQDFLNLYYYYLLRIENCFTYNKYLDKLITRHINNLVFEYAHPYSPKSVEKKKHTKGKRKVTNAFIKQKTTDMFTGKDVYFYDNPKTGEHYESSNPDLARELKRKKRIPKSIGKSSVPLEAMTFDFNIKKQ